MNFFLHFCRIALPLLLCTGSLLAESLNDQIGIPLFPDSGALWSEKTADMVKRLAKKKIKLTPPSGPVGVMKMSLSGEVFGVKAQEMRIFCDLKDGISVPVKVDLFFANKGDIPKNYKRMIKRDRLALKKELTAVYGSGQNTFYGPGGMKQMAVFWKAPEAGIYLEYVPGEYTIVHLQNGNAEEKTSGNAVEKINRVYHSDLLENVKRSPFGDCWIENIPMIDQGSKGYCFPATMERLFLYYGVKNVDMHRIADAAKTKKGGGTNCDDLNSGLKSVFSKAHLKVIRLGTPRVSTIQRYVEKGIPVIWLMKTCEEYETLCGELEQNRKKCVSPKAWKKELKKLRMPKGKFGNHACMVYGVNAQTGELAVSNSWQKDAGKFLWIPEKLVNYVSLGTCYIYLPSDFNSSAAKSTKKKIHRENI